ncbi:MAG: hypothetical protein K8R40_01620 [Anaerolineaceae bacterium]|nr:hypothetical protein [Anaerolineaceae bacterium]
MRYAAIDWLLSLKCAPITYRVKTELLDQSQDAPDVVEVKARIQYDPDIVGLFDRMHPDGYWLQKDYKGRIWGDGARYGSFGTTHFVLSYLSELGMDCSDPRIDKAAQRYLGLQLDDGSWGGHYSCRYTYNVRTFVKLGYRDEPGIQKTIDLMLNTNRKDGGYLCDIHEGKYKTRPTKSCIRGCTKALLAFAELPEYWNHPRCIELVDYFLRHEIIYSTKIPKTFINKDISRFAYPIHWRTSLWEPLYALSKMGYSKHPAMERAWHLLESRLDQMGRAPLDYTPAQCPWKTGKRGKINPWVTLYVLLAQKYRLERGLEGK